MEEEREPEGVTDWRLFLERLSEALLDDARIREDVPEEVARSGWMGYDGATAEEIAELERHLGVTLPPSYRAFLEVSNGWRDTGAFIYRLWSTREVEWLSVRNQDLIDIFSEYIEATPDPDPESMDADARQIRSALEISDNGDAALLMLNPCVVDAEGEWEAWFYASWAAPNVRRYRSFAHLMRAQLDGFIELRGVE